MFHLSSGVDKLEMWLYNPCSTQGRWSRYLGLEAGTGKGDSYRLRDTGNFLYGKFLVVV